MTSTDAIAKQILARRRDVISDLFKGPAGQELVRLDSAFKALTGKEPPSLSEVLTGGDVAEVTDTVGISNEVVHNDEAVPVPVKTATRELMINTDRTWTYDAMLEHWETEGVTFDAKNLRDALRTAVLQLMEEGVVERVQRGVYRPKKHSHPADIGPSGDHQEPDDGGDW